MAERNVKKGIAGKLTSCFVLVYLHVVTSTEPPSGEVNMEGPPSPALDLDPHSFAVDVSAPGIAPRAATPNNNGNLHPVIRIIQEKELGKAVIALAISIATMVLTAGKDKLAQSEMSLILILLCVGFAAIFNGILLKETFPEFAQIAEPVGIALVATAFYAVVAFFLPDEISWVPVVCIVLCLLPFGAIAVWRPPPN